jgi:hypothetical protein
MLLLGYYFDVSCKYLFICFVISCPSLASSANLFVSFNLTFMQVFERLLGPSFLECLDTLLVH